MDLRRVYLQIWVHKTLWLYQIVEIDEKSYCLTYLGFKFYVAPLIFKAIYSSLLLYKEPVDYATSAYIPDIFVDEDAMLASEVKEHLAWIGLEHKDPE